MKHSAQTLSGSAAITMLKSFINTLHSPLNSPHHSLVRYVVAPADQHKLERLAQASGGRLGWGYMGEAGAGESGSWLGRGRRARGWQVGEVGAHS